MLNHMRTLLISILFFSCLISKAQHKIEIDFRKKFNDAQTLYIDEKFSKALPLFLSLDSVAPDNANIAYKIGVCYLHSSSSKTKSLNYLKRAVSNTSIDCKEDNCKEKNAPVDVYYQLGHAFHLNNQPDSAIIQYTKFKTFLYEKDSMINVVNHQIDQCQVAKEMLSSPVEVKIQNLGSNINSPYDDYSAVFPADESIIYFTSKRPGSTGQNSDIENNYFEDIYLSHKKDTLWTPAENIGHPISTNGNEATVAISIDGQKLFIYRDDKGDGNIYMSQLQKDGWTEPSKLNENINSTNWEPSASLSADGTILYFSSNRPGGYGGRDIYMSKLLPNGLWGKAQNLGPTINTAYDEDCPFIHPDGSTLFFSSNGHKSMGGFDVFFSIKPTDKDSWSEPINIGYPVNSADDDLFYVPTADNKRAYFSTSREGGLGEKDIYMITFPEQKEAQLAVYKGTIKGENGGAPGNVEITIVDNNTGELTGTYFPNPETGNYLFILTPGGNYNISYQADGYLLESQDIKVPKDSVYSITNASIQLSSITIGHRIVLKNIKFEKSSSKLTPNSKLEIDHLYKLLSDKTNTTVEIGAHAFSAKLTDKQLLKLSQERAQVVVSELIALGIDSKRLIPKGYGLAMPLEKWSVRDTLIEKNNRIDYKIVSIGKSNAK